MKNIKILYIHRQQHNQNNQIINKIYDIMGFFSEIDLKITSPLENELI